MPIVDGLVSLVLTMIETAKGYFSVKISKYNKSLRDDQEVPYEQTQVIGFGNYLSEQPEGEEEFYEDE